jgi:GNAT superfamily N-acetyltransferase
VSLAYATDRRPDVDAIRALYAAAPLRRPIHDAARIRRMYEGSNVVLTAWDGERLVGIARGLSDGCFDGYLADLAVHPDYQNRGVGRRLLELARSLNPEVQWVLLASPVAKDYYAHLGWSGLPNAWRLNREGWDYHQVDYDTYKAQHAELAARA